MKLRLPKLPALFVSALFCLLLQLTAVPAQAAAPASDWRYYLKDAGGTRYTTLDQIDRSNVKYLRVAWVYHTGQGSDDLKTSIECNPLVIELASCKAQEQSRWSSLSLEIPHPRWSGYCCHPATT